MNIKPQCKCDYNFTTQEICNEFKDWKDPQTGELTGMCANCIHGKECHEEVML